MSNKQWRKPVEGAEAPSEAERRKRDETIAAYEKAAADFYQVFRTVFKPDLDAPFEDDYVHGKLSDITNTLWQIVSITGCVLSTIDVRQLRQIVGPELKLPEALRTFIADTDWEEADFLETPENAPTEDEKAVKGTPAAKRPRGARHPLLGLIDQAIKAARLFERITRGTHPNVYNKRTLQEKDNAAWDKVLG